MTPIQLIDKPLLSGLHDKAQALSHGQIVRIRDLVFQFVPVVFVLDHCPSSFRLLSTPEVGSSSSMPVSYPPNLK